MRVKGGSEWYVKRVVDKRVKDGVIEYKLEYEGNFPDEWQPEYCVKRTGQAAIDDYLKSITATREKAAPTTKKGRKRKEH